MPHDERWMEGAKTELFLLREGSSGARHGPRKKFWKSVGATKMVASSNRSIFTVSRDHLDEGPQNTNELPRVSFANILKIRGCHEDGRQLEPLHFYRVP